MSELYLKVELESDLAVVIEVFNGCAFAYLYRSGDILGDTWLFNCSASNWSSDHRHPGPNPPENCREPFCLPIPIESDFQVVLNPDNRLVALYLQYILIGIVWEGARPGKSAFAAKDSGWAVTMNSLPSLDGFQTPPPRIP